MSCVTLVVHTVTNSLLVTHDLLGNHKVQWTNADELRLIKYPYVRRVD